MILGKLKFRDQPNGQCHKCKWNLSSGDTLNCDVPTTHLSNAICIQKRSMIVMQNIAYDVYEENNENEFYDDWRDENA